jgi:hypothetical protein
VRVEADGFHRDAARNEHTRDAALRDSGPEPSRGSRPADSMPAERTGRHAAPKSTVRATGRWRRVSSRGRTWRDAYPEAA